MTATDHDRADDDWATDDPAELHARLIAWADTNNDYVIPTCIAYQIGSYQAFLRLERLGGCENALPGFVIRKAAVITDDGWHVCERCERLFIPDPSEKPSSPCACNTPGRQPCQRCDEKERWGFCSEECRRTVDCAQCGRPYLPDNGSRPVPGYRQGAFCSDDCRDYYWMHEHPVGQLAWPNSTYMN
ncbi:hypothetical protein A9X05_05255 [Mycobacterium sp. E3298]|uniref:hypothetical protein n=1 Tax=Mycobacterium sp. E3298 TaxID=1856865 RepID=UPI0007FD8726|nr:hypothetical protein [Mycobacterium sp. E3298]OBG69242.1 hypothetical protein A9X05_05255 [Mycobacterium sp. E3298]